MKVSKTQICGTACLDMMALCVSGWMSRMTAMANMMVSSPEGKQEMLTKRMIR